MVRNNRPFRSSISISPCLARLNNDGDRPTRGVGEHSERADPGPIAYPRVRTAVQLRDEVAPHTVVGTEEAAAKDAAIRSQRGDPHAVVETGPGIEYGVVTSVGVQRMT
jgi:hypothetical protein